MQNKSVLIYSGFLLDCCHRQLLMTIFFNIICFSLVQLMTNDKFISVYHRVLSKTVGPRISIASFFMNFTISECTSKVYGPIKELLSEENTPHYRDITMNEILTNYYAKGLDGNSYLRPLRL